MNTPDSQKDWAEGAVLLLQLSGNKIMYRNISVNPKGKAEFIKGKLQQYLNFRLQSLTKEQVNEMQAEVDEIVEKVIKPFAVAESLGTDAGSTSAGKSEEFAAFKAGKRSDHDSLPAEIQALYVENLDIIHRMRELHLKLRTLSLDNATCPDSERYPFLKEIIALDKRLHANWDTYDHFVIGNTPITEAPASDTEEEAKEKAEEKAEETPTEEQDTVSEDSPEVTDSPVVENAPKATETATAAAPAEEKPKKSKSTGKRTTKKASKKE